jgi:hypothetical protein
MSDMKKRLTKYTSTAVVSGAMWQLLHASKGNNINTPVGQVPTWVVGGALGVVGSFSADLVHQFVLPHISSDKRFQHVEAAVLNVGASSGAYVLGSQALNSSLISDTGGVQMMAVIGGVSELASEWVYLNVLLPFVDADSANASSF